MEEKGGKRRCVDRVENSVSVSVREAQVEDKQPCEDLDQSFVENPSSASASASSSETIPIHRLKIRNPKRFEMFLLLLLVPKGRVTGGYILKHLAVVASNFPRDCHEEDLVNSSLATTTVKRATKHPAFHSAPQIKEVAEDAFFKLPTPLAPVYAESGCKFEGILV
ncbi:hypothetical protein R6Q59_036344 [Mikania micrantha]